MARALLVWVRAPHFCCGLRVDGETGRVVDAAPIVKWARGKTWGYVSGYLAKKGYAYCMWPEGRHPSEAGGDYIEQSGSI